MRTFRVIQSNFRDHNGNSLDMPAILIEDGLRWKNAEWWVDNAPANKALPNHINSPYHMTIEKDVFTTIKKLDGEMTHGFLDQVLISYGDSIKRKFCIEISRTETKVKSFIVTGDDIDEAIQMAYEMASNFDFNSVSDQIVEYDSTDHEELED